MKKKRNYDKKVRLTRILLADYILLKGYAQEAGVSMAEALHKVITRDWAMAKSAIKAPGSLAFRVTAPVTLPVTAPVALPATAPVAYRSGPITAIATNGNKAVAFRIKPKGVSYD